MKVNLEQEYIKILYSMFGDKEWILDFPEDREEEVSNIASILGQEAEPYGLEWDRMIALQAAEEWLLRHNL